MRIKIHYLYKIVNSVNNKIYVGYTIDPIRRWKAHLNLAKNSSSTSHLHRAMRKYGIGVFRMESLMCSLDGTHMLKVMEPYFIKLFDSKENGYNLTDGGESNFGWTPSLETRKKMSEAWKGRVISLETREKQRQRMRLAPPMHNPETRKKVSDTLKERGIRPILTPERREEKRLAQIGKPIHTEAYKEGLSIKYKKFNPMNTPQAREKSRKNKIGKGTGVRNGKAIFCEIYNPSSELVISGHLRTICEELNYPSYKFLANTRSLHPIQRGEWTGWNVVKISRPKIV